MKKRRNKSGVYQYLDSLGLLEKGSEDAIAMAKKEYWKQYKYAWLKNRRKNKSLTIYFNETEYSLICKAAYRHKRSNTAFAKQAALAYIRQKFIVPDVVTVNEIKGLFTQIFAQLKELATDKKLSYRDLEKHLKILASLELEVFEKLTNPKTAGNDS